MNYILRFNRKAVTSAPAANTATNPGTLAELFVSGVWVEMGSVVSMAVGCGVDVFTGAPLVFDSSA